MIRNLIENLPKTKEAIINFMNVGFAFVHGYIDSYDTAYFAPS